jgi:hypothetical protein
VQGVLNHLWVFHVKNCFYFSPMSKTLKTNLVHYWKNDLCNLSDVIKIEWYKRIFI